MFDWNGSVVAKVRDEENSVTTVSSNGHANPVRECGYELQDASSLCNHFRPGYFFKKEYCCRICLAVFASSCAWSAHVRMHGNNGPFVCPEYDQELGSTEKRGRHLLIHYAERCDTLPWICPVCLKYYRRPQLAFGALDPRARGEAAQLLTMNETVARDFSFRPSLPAEALVRKSRLASAVLFVRYCQLFLEDQRPRRSEASLRRARQAEGSPDQMLFLRLVVSNRTGLLSTISTTTPPTTAIDKTWKMASPEKKTGSYNKQWRYPLYFGTSTAEYYPT
ncbi:Zinc finger protein [Trichinella zimbabwensis]|uniref:Zinc finger protein n=1 Tax=Trichinella zimbabwensis TaxID=268475 RepID=A0A0V1I3A1_9BILA|nr:Zinc finger protein [Trichinella zimbabwensis]